MEEKDNFIVVKLSRVKEAAEAINNPRACPKACENDDDKLCGTYFVNGGCYQCWFDYLIDIGIDEAL